jgi:hypothetical protein
MLFIWVFTSVVGTALGPPCVRYPRLLRLQSFPYIYEHNIEAADQTFASSLVKSIPASQMNLNLSSHPIDLTSEPCPQFARALRGLGIWPTPELRIECHSVTEVTIRRIKTIRISEPIGPVSYTEPFERPDKRLAGGHNSSQAVRLYDIRSNQ